MYTVETILLAIKYEHEAATSKFPVKFTCRHHAIGVIREEYIELEQEVFKSEKTVNIELIHKEAVQLAAMCVRLLTEIDKTNLNPRDYTAEINELKEKIEHLEYGGENV